MRKEAIVSWRKKSSATLVLLNVSSVFTSEKHKAEMRDRKVLEILQFKDHMIEELEQVWYILKNNSLITCKSSSAAQLVYV